MRQAGRRQELGQLQDRPESHQTQSSRCDNRFLRLPQAGKLEDPSCQPSHRRVDCPARRGSNCPSTLRAASPTSTANSTQTQVMERVQLLMSTMFQHQANNNSNHQQQRRSRKRSWCRMQARQRTWQWRVPAPCLLLCAEAATMKASTAKQKPADTLTMPPAQTAMEEHSAASAHCDRGWNSFEISTRVCARC